ncbi:hypothetical protein [Streptomyces milbemycinicus]|uniref:Uncharacterized protein n=1 Tax=Streptomyces milbemycinicus TaxID=476552 RepID=A0ABW8LQN3_9ACTN
MDDVGSRQDFVVENLHEGTELTCALLGQRVQHGFKAIPEVAGIASALRDAAARTRERVRDVPEWSVRQGLPVPEGFRRGLGPEAGSFEPPQIGCA